MKLIPLNQGRGTKSTTGKFAKVSDKDFKKLSKHKWRLSGVNTGRGSVMRNDYKAGKVTIVSMGRVILGIRSKNYHVYYKDGDNLNLQRSNLVKVSRGLKRNAAPAYKNKKGSKYKGVHRSGKQFYIRITVNKKQHGWDGFTSERAAAKAYDKLAKELLGDKAFLNFK